VQLAPVRSGPGVIADRDPLMECSIPAEPKRIVTPSRAATPALRPPAPTASDRTLSPGKPLIWPVMGGAAMPDRAIHAHPWAEGYAGTVEIPI